MNILLLGSGGRESALSWKLKQSPKCEKLFIAPGNGGTSQYGENIALDLNDFASIKNFVLRESIEMVISGPEEPLVNGIHDFFAEDPDLKKIAFVGPKKQGAILEGSKDFSKLFMQRHNIPAGASRTFTADSIQEGLNYLSAHALPIVLKADGLAAGKGVVICSSVPEAQEELQNMLGGKFGAAGNKVVIEEFLDGIELSVFVLTDGNHYVILPEAKDYKKIGLQDTGLNTGGMGSVSPVPFATPEFLARVEERIIKPTILGLQKDEIEYTGFIFFGIIKVKDEPYLIEYNCRLGDPETESVVPRLKNDLVELFVAATSGNLNSVSISMEANYAATVMLVSGGYPGKYENGKSISGLENVRNSIAFHAGTVRDGSDIITNGGRVVAITSLQPTLFEAIQSAIADASRIYFDGKYFREDIGFDL